MDDAPPSSRVFRAALPPDHEERFPTDRWLLQAHRGDEMRPMHRTIIHALHEAARAKTSRGITLLPDKETAQPVYRSYRDIERSAVRYAASLLARGVRPDDRVLMVLPTSHEFVAAFLATQMLRAVPVPSYPPAMLERAAQALERILHTALNAETAWCITNKQLWPLLGELALRAKSVRAIVTVEQLDEEDENATIRAKVRPETPGFIQYTSGSTGSPKGVLLTHANLVANIQAIGQAVHIARTDVQVSWLPLYHDMGLIGGLLLPIYWNLPLVLMSPATFLLKPSRWLRAIHDYRGTFSPAPNFAFALCVRSVTDEQRAGLDLSSWRVAFNGAEQVNAATLESFQERYGPHGFRRETMLPVYGLAESSLAVTFPDVDAPPRWETVDRVELAAGRARLAEGEGTVRVTSVGSPLPGHSVLIVDEHGVAVPEREVGHLVASGPSIMEGYFRNPEATNAVLRDGWLWTGDLAYLAEGEFFVVGRAKDVIIVNGRNYYADDIEVVAEKIEGVRGGGTAAFGVTDDELGTEQLVLVCETKVKDDEARKALASEVAKRVQQGCGVRVDIVATVDPNTIPRTSSGKRQRSLCRDLYLKGELQRQRTGKLQLAWVFVRSGAGFLVMNSRKLVAGRRRSEPT